MEVNSSSNNANEKEFKKLRGGKKNKKEFPFDSKDNTIMILNSLLRYGDEKAPFNIIPNMSLQKYQSEMDWALEMTKAIVKDKPSIAHWLYSGIFEENNELIIPLALLCIARYEQHPSPDRKDVECNFKEIYQFLYHMTLNQPMSHLSENSAKVLHEVLSEVIEEVWPNTQLDLLNYLGDIHMYSRSAARRMYPGKRLNTKKAVENHSS
ncbi:uncharacterized protein LOC105194145 isoform X1 [Solenopsis invicta]|uniref:uncharacterized protein LOC105194145 isoform X1 n=2 Tax=Solenopsis invicta TaxID=13686 RepID=UPI000595D8E2|nr:uncharacterized protein LOC105194145 isoform X1 [Solenopsis invicta]